MVKQYLQIDGASEDGQPFNMTNMDEVDEDAEEDSHAPNRMGKMSDPESSESAKSKGNSNWTSEDSKILSSFPKVPLMVSSNAAPVSAFQRTLAQNWNPPSNFGERGTLLVSGLVHMEGPKGACVLDVAASYHPGESRYTVVQCGIRNFRQRVQRPRGGP